MTKYFSIKRDYHAMCKDLHMFENTEESVIRFSKIAILALFNVHFRTYRAIETDDANFLAQVYDGDKFKAAKFFNEVTNYAGLDKFDDDDFLVIMRQNGIDAIENATLSQAIKIQTIKFETNFANNIRMHHLKHVIAYLNFFYREDVNMMDRVNEATNFLFTPDNDRIVVNQLDDNLKVQLSLLYRNQITEGCFDGMASLDTWYVYNEYIKIFAGENNFNTSMVVHVFHFSGINLFPFWCDYKSKSVNLTNKIKNSNGAHIKSFHNILFNAFICNSIIKR